MVFVVIFYTKKLFTIDYNGTKMLIPLYLHFIKHIVVKKDYILPAKYK